MKAQPGDRVRIKIKHQAYSGHGEWATVDARQDRTHCLVIYDGRTKRRAVHDLDIVEVVR